MHSLLDEFLTLAHSISCEYRLNFDTRATILLICWDAIYHLINFGEKNIGAHPFQRIKSLFSLSTSFLCDIGRLHHL